MHIHLEVKDHKVELIMKLLEHIPFVEIKDNQMLKAQLAKKSVCGRQPKRRETLLSRS